MFFLAAIFASKLLEPHPMEQVSCVSPSTLSLISLMTSWIMESKVEEALGSKGFGIERAMGSFWNKLKIKGEIWRSASSIEFCIKKGSKS